MPWLSRSSIPSRLRRGAELLGAIAGASEQALGQLLGRDALAAREVDQLAVQPVARGQPLVLVEHLVGVLRQRLPGLEVLGQLLHERLDQRGERERVVDVGL